MEIPLIVAREEEWFQREVVIPWAESYRRGQTPNPCILCNPSTKFALLCREAKALGFDTVVTGHYAGIEEREGRYLLKKAKFLPRDQSYMLYRLSQEQLSMLHLPLAGMSKDEVRAIAAQAGLPCACAPDSQEICFIPDNDYPSYIEERFGKMPEGEFVSPEGTVCGTHKGLLHYTVGQRKGLGRRDNARRDIFLVHGNRNARRRGRHLHRGVDNAAGARSICRGTHHIQPARHRKERSFIQNDHSPNSELSLADVYTHNETYVSER